MFAEIKCYCCICMPLHPGNVCWKPCADTGSDDVRGRRTCSLSTEPRWVILLATSANLTQTLQSARMRPRRQVWSVPSYLHTTLRSMALLTAATVRIITACHFEGCPLELNNTCKPAGKVSSILLRAVGKLQVWSSKFWGCACSQMDST